MKYLSLIFFYIFSNFFCSKVFSQDSLKVFFIGSGVKGEKFQIYYSGKLIQELSSGNYHHYFKILRNPFWNENKRIPIVIYRKGPFGLRYRDTEMVPYFVPGYKYLVFKRRPQLKNKYSIDFVWENEPPFK